MSNFRDVAAKINECTNRSSIKCLIAGLVRDCVYLFLFKFCGSISAQIFYLDC